MKPTYEELEDVLADALEFLEGYEDIADLDEDCRPVPNRAMQLCNQIRHALGQRPGP